MNTFTRNINLHEDFSNCIKITMDEFNSISGKTQLVEHFVFDKFVLKSSDSGFVVFVKCIKGSREFLFATTFKGEVGWGLYEIYYNNGRFIAPFSEETDANYLEMRSDAEGFFEIITRVMWHIMTYQRDRKEKRPIPHKYSREHRISTSENKVYLLDDIVKYVHDNYVPQGGTHNIQCECWEVRGHYRTYKSGKKVWINAFKKGKKRNEMEPKDKTYYLSKGVTV